MIWPLVISFIHDALWGGYFNRFIAFPALVRRLLGVSLIGVPFGVVFGWQIGLVIGLSFFIHRIVAWRTWEFTDGTPFDIYDGVPLVMDSRTDVIGFYFICMIYALFATAGLVYLGADVAETFSALGLVAALNTGTTYIINRRVSHHYAEFARGTIRTIGTAFVVSSQQLGFVLSLQEVLS